MRERGNPLLPEPSFLISMRVFLLLAAVALQIWAQPANTTAPGSVRGTVVGASSEPLRKADVVLRAVGSDSGGRRGVGGGVAQMAAQTTDATGAFAFEQVPPGSYAISVHRNGFVPYDGFRRGVSQQQGPAAINVAAGQATTGITIRLSPQGVIAGRVIDEDGDPMQFTSVQVLRERWVNGRRQLLPQNADSSDDRGEFRLSGLMPGKYFLMATVHRPSELVSGRAPSKDGDQTYAALYFPGTPDATQAVPIQVQGGQEVRADFQLRKVTTYRIRGKVLDEAGKPLMHAAVMALPYGGGFFGVRAMGVSRGNDGTFEIISVQPGAYTLTVNRGGEEDRGQRMAGRLPVQVGNRDLDGVVIQLQRTFGITGILRVADPTVQLGNARVMLENLDSGLPFPGFVEVTMKAGAFTASGAMPGRYRFTVVNPPQGTYLAAVTFDGQDITLGADISGPASGIEVVLGSKAPEVTGTVLNADKQPVAGATVVLVPEASKRSMYWLFRNAESGSRGEFMFRSMPPGNYTLYVMPGVEDGSWQDPEVLRQYEGKGVTLKLEEGSKENIQLSTTS